MPGTTTDHRQVLVVGAGWTGLISAKTYLDLAPGTDLLIVDNERSIGGVWCKERLYPDLYAQVSHPLFEYSFYDMPREGITPDGFLSGYTINKYLNNFARDFGLESKIRLETIVTEVKRSSSGSWLVSFDHGPDVITDKLIWAVGPGSSAVQPSWPSKGFTQPIIHSADTGSNLDRISKVERATVVGAAKSAFDTVYFLLKAGKKVDWIIREEGGGPIAMGPPSLFGVINTVDALSTRAMASFSPSIMRTSGFWYHAIQRTRIGRLAARGFWRFANFLADYAAGYSENDHFAKIRPEPHGYGMFWARAGLGAPSAPNFWKTMHSGELNVIRSEVESLSHVNVVNLKNGISVQTDMVIACIGFEKPYRPFDRELRKELGLAYDEVDAARWAELDAQASHRVDELLPMLKEYAPATSSVDVKTEAVLHGPNRHYRRLIPLKLAASGDRSICFPGLVHVIVTPTISEFQALWNAAYMLNLLELPTLDEMEMEVAVFNAWVRKRHLEMGQKHSYCIFDYLSYIDTLAGDLGIKTARKSNPFSEAFVRYKPSDYRGLIDEFLAAQNKDK
uniref:FAD/NAD(P)-binding domain-containing protein n=1 Tax=Bionectria ochroleuca TaxID=29856 RepID=A0A8H7K9T4_BIOOC